MTKPKRKKKTKTIWCELKNKNVESKKFGRREKNGGKYPWIGSQKWTKERRRQNTQGYYHMSNGGCLSDEKCKVSPLVFCRPPFESLPVRSSKRKQIVNDIIGKLVALSIFLLRRFGDGFTVFLFIDPGQWKMRRCLKPPFFSYGLWKQMSLRKQSLSVS